MACPRARVLCGVVLQALADTNALLAGALALHFAADVSHSGFGGESDVHRSCCALAFHDAADVQVHDRRLDWRAVDVESSAFVLFASI